MENLNDCNDACCQEDKEETIEKEAYHPEELFEQRQKERLEDKMLSNDIKNRAKDLSGIMNYGSPCMLDSIQLYYSNKGITLTIKEIDNILKLNI